MNLFVNAGAKVGGFFAFTSFTHGNFTRFYPLFRNL